MAFLGYDGIAMIEGLNVMELADTGITASNYVAFLGFGCVGESDGLIAAEPVSESSCNPHWLCGRLTALYLETLNENGLHKRPPTCLLRSVVLSRSRVRVGCLT